MRDTGFELAQKATTMNTMIAMARTPTNMTMPSSIWPGFGFSLRVRHNMPLSRVETGALVYRGNHDFGIVKTTNPQTRHSVAGRAGSMRRLAPAGIRPGYWGGLNPIPVRGMKGRYARDRLACVL